MQKKYQRMTHLPSAILRMKQIVLMVMNHRGKARHGRTRAISGGWAVEEMSDFFYLFIYLFVYFIFYRYILFLFFYENSHFVPLLTKVAQKWVN